MGAVTKGWVFGWVKKQFAGKKKPLPLLRLLPGVPHHKLRFRRGNVYALNVENNRCDQLAVAAANDKAHLLEDTGYEP